MRISTGPSQKLGTLIPRSATNIAAESQIELRLIAAIVPAGIAMRTAMNIATDASNAVAANRSLSNSITGRPLKIDLPQSALTKPLRKWPY